MQGLVVVLETGNGPEDAGAAWWQGETDDTFLFARGLGEFGV